MLTTTLNTNQALAMMRGAADHVGVPVPKALTDAVAHGADLVARAGALSADGDALANAVADALEAGRDPRSDKAVQAQLVGEQLAARDIARLVRDRADAATAAVMADVAPAYLEALAEPAATAGATLTEAVAALPPSIDLDDPASAAGLTPDSAAMWAAARAALTVLDAVRSAWSGAADAGGVARLNPNHRLSVLADLSAPAHDALGSRATPWQIVSAGHSIVLATGSTYRERVQRIATEREQARAATEQQALYEHTGKMPAGRIG